MKNQVETNQTPLHLKICLTIPEASELSGFTVKAIKDMIKNDPDNNFAVYKEFKQGRTQLIRRKEFEEYISKTRC